MSDAMARPENIPTSAYFRSAAARFNAHGYLCAVYDRRPAEPGFMAYVAVPLAHPAGQHIWLRSADVVAGGMYDYGLDVNAHAGTPVSYLRLGRARDKAILPTLADAVIEAVEVAGRLRGVADQYATTHPEGALTTLDTTLDKRAEQDAASCV